MKNKYPWLSKISDQDLLSFLKEYIQDDPRLAQAIEKHFLDIITDGDDFKKFEKKLNYIFYGNNDRFYEQWGSSPDVAELLKESIDSFLEEFDLFHANRYLLKTYQVAVEYGEYDDETLYDSVDIIDKIIWYWYVYLPLARMRQGEKVIDPVVKIILYETPNNILDNLNIEWLMDILL